MRLLLFVFVFLMIFQACSDRSRKEEAVKAEEVRVVPMPAFVADSAYYFIERQVAFGPRIPNTQAHRQAADFFVSEFKKRGAEVVIQDFTATTYDNQKLALRNVVASFFPEKQKRILLAAHWDTRPFSDKDPENPRGYFDGANDGASGAGVLLEIARALAAGPPPPNVGVDMILFDGEDWGFDEQTAETLYGRGKQFPLPQGQMSWWCLGSQYWARNRHKPGYSAYYGILLDMVGGQQSVFAKEAYSMEYAPGIVNKVWNTAARLGFGHVFINKTNGAITDDHVFVNELARIPMINIISYDPQDGSFGSFHHTRQDNLSLISRDKLHAVGTTLMQVLYYE
ncbi:MAG: glutamine cyclotransferase [Cyclobacteriaceae bacterium]|nr:MAG: glutamine cyclotransferase [Cyclobacteriaceae bacterium]